MPQARRVAPYRPVDGDDLSLEGVDNTLVDQRSVDSVWKAVDSGGASRGSERTWRSSTHPCLRMAVERVLRNCHGNRQQAAQAIGVDVDTLNRWLSE